MILSFIWDKHHCLPQATYPRIRTSSLYTCSLEQVTPFTWSFNPQGLPAISVAGNAVSSYLTFSLLPFAALAKKGFPNQASDFKRKHSSLWHFLFSCDFSQETFPLGSVALCVVRTFLHAKDCAAIERPVFILCKNS